MDVQDTDGAIAPAQNTRRLAVFTITSKEGRDRDYWTRVGTGFVNRDASFTIYLEALPVNGKLHVREFEPGRKPRNGEGE